MKELPYNSDGDVLKKRETVLKYDNAQIWLLHRVLVPGSRIAQRPASMLLNGTEQKMY